MTLRAYMMAGFVAISVALSAGQGVAGDLLYKLHKTTSLPSTDSGWDYIKMEPGGNRLFMARDKDGLTVFDVDRHQVVATVENSVGANGPLLLPEYDRGYVAMTDGSLLIFQLTSLKVIDRIQLDQDGGLNSAIYDPVTKQVHAIVSSRPAQSTWYTLDAASGKFLGKKTFPFRKMDDPAPDGKGRLFAPARYDNLILVLDSKTLKEIGRWDVGCNVSKTRYQSHTKHILAACLGEAPIFMALNPDTGQAVARLPIGKGLDGFVVDESRHRIVTSNGADGTLTVIQQETADNYSLLGTVSTRIGARMMHIDERTGRLFVVNADYTLGQVNPDTGKAKRIYHPDSFVVLTYQPD